MPRTRRSRFRTFAVLVFFGIVLGCCYLLLKSTELEPDLGSPRRAEPIDLELADLETEGDFETPRSSAFPLEVLEARALEIHGRVVDGLLQPLAEFDVVCGIETALTDDDGRFVFPARVRPGPATVAVRRAGAEVVRWSDVVVGDISDAPFSYADVSRPVSLRWSITLFGAPSAEDVLTLDNVLVEEWGRSGVVHVHGSGKLPETAEIRAAVYFEGDRLVSGDQGSGLTNGAYRLRFTLPDDFRFFSDEHEVEISFSTVYHEFELVERWKIERPELPWEDLLDYAFTRTIYIGLPEEEREDNLRVENYFRRVLPTAIDMWTLLEEQFKYSSKLKRGWDPTAVEMEVDSHEGWIVSGAIDRTGQFRETEWRSFIDDQLRPRLVELAREHSLLTDEKYPRATFLMDRVLKDILNLSRMDSMIIYQELFGLRPHPRDFYHDDYKPSGDRVLILKMIKQHLGLLRRFLSLSAPEVGGDSNR